MTHHVTTTHRTTKSAKADKPRKSKPAAASNDRLLASERDTLDMEALDLDGDGLASFASAPTALRAPISPSISYADDHEAIAPEDLGKEWLERATESEQSGSLSPTAAQISALSIEEIAEAADDDIYERDTEPNIDVAALRAAAQHSGKG